MTTPHPDALAAVARTRAEGLHFWGRMLGVTTVSPADRSTRVLAASSSDVTAVATLADVCLGYAIRTELGPQRRLATTSISVQHVADPRGPITCDSRLVWMHPDGGRALAEAHVEDTRGDLVATAQAWFAVLPVPEGTAVVPMPWEVPDGTPAYGSRACRGAALDPADLTPAESAATTAATEALQRAAVSGLPLAEELFGARWCADGSDRLVGTAPTGPHLGNRIGNVQGGAIYGIAAVAAGRLVTLSRPSQRLVEGAVQYLRPGVGDAITVMATATRRGRTASFVQSLVEIDGSAVASAHFTFMA